VFAVIEDESGEVNAFTTAFERVNVVSVVGWKAVVFALVIKEER
jgi:hypothetical protein